MTLRQQMQKRIEELANVDATNALLDLVCTVDSVLKYYVDNCDVTGWDMLGGDGAPIGVLPFDEGWEKATDARSKIKAFVEGKE